MKKVVVGITLVLALVLSLTLVGCSSAKDDTADKDSAENVQIPNPWTDFDTLEAAEAQAGFALAAPEHIGAYAPGGFRVFDTGMLEVVYADSAQHTLCLRKAMSAEDISGDYTTYAQRQTLDVDGVAVTADGSDGWICRAVWQADGYAYAITAAEGISEEALTEAVAAVMR